MIHIKFGFGWPSGFREEDVLNCRRTDGRTPDHGHPISSPCEPNGSGELKSRSNRSFNISNVECDYHKLK